MYYIIVNPASKSGRGAEIWALLEPILNKKEIEYRVFFSKKAGHVIDLIRELENSATANEPDAVLKLIVLGGDGTLNEVLQGITDREHTQIGYIPTGSSNDMARDLQLPKDPIKVLENILSCSQPVFMDIGCLTYEDSAGALSRQHSREVTSRRFFAVSCGIGFDAAICEEALSSRFKNILNRLKLGKLTYVAIALKQLIMARRTSCRITLDDKETILLPKFLFVANMIHQYQGGGFKFCPGADCHDGILDLCVAGDISKWTVLLALPSAYKGEHFRFKGIKRYSASKVRIEASAPLWVHTDGEVSRQCSTITMVCEKEKLQLLM